MAFFDQLEQRVREINSLLCVGLDPHPNDLPSPSADHARDFCLGIIHQTVKSAAAFKPNSSFFEGYGASGISALREVIAAVPSEIPVILDAKRGDIASSAEGYARAGFEVLGAQAMTINPYLGRDAIEPFLRDPDRGVFLLCKTSNLGSGDLQDLPLGENHPLSGEPDYLLYEKVAHLAKSWNTVNNLGLVVGATHAEALARVRRIAPELWILVPGVGAQGGDLHAVLQAGLRPDGLGLLITVSRSISRSANPGEVAEEMRQQINTYKLIEPQSSSVYAASQASGWIAQLADELLQAGCIKFGEFKLKSGLFSPIYIDLRLLVSFPRLLDRAAKAYITILNSLSFDRLVGLPYAALPIATAISIQTGWPVIYPRKEAKSYGTMADIEGIYREGEKVVIIDDLATTGESKFEAIEKLKQARLKVEDVVVLIDRQSGANQALANAGYKLHAVATLSQLLDYYEASQKVAPEQTRAARDFISSSA